MTMTVIFTLALKPSTVKSTTSNQTWSIDSKFKNPDGTESYYNEQGQKSL